MNEETKREIAAVVAVFSNKKFRTAVRNEAMGRHFTYTDQGWENVCRDFNLQCERIKKGDVKFSTFRSKNPWSSSNGYVLKDQIGEIHLNNRKNLDIPDTLKFVTHEIMHFAKYNHGTGRCANSMRWVCGGTKKLKSVPVLMAEIAKEVYLKGGWDD